MNEFIASILKCYFIDCKYCELMFVNKFCEFTAYNYKINIKKCKDGYIILPYKEINSSTNEYTDFSIILNVDDKDYIRNITVKSI